MGYETIRLEKPFTIDEIVSIHYFEYTSTYAFEGEQHDFWEFLYVDKGEVSVRAGETDHTLRKGQIIFHKPGEFHSLHACGGTAPNLIVVGFVCESPAMAYFENRVESPGSRRLSDRDVSFSIWPGFDENPSATFFQTDKIPG